MINNIALQEEEEKTEMQPVVQIKESDFEWAKTGNYFYPSSKSDKIKILDPGIFSYKTSMMGWYLEKMHDRFQFPYKIYNANEELINRTITLWKHLKNSCGILLNGTKGTGKSVTVQLIANKLVELNVPVLVIYEPVKNLMEVVQRCQQDIVIIFDEFEKTHTPENQQEILTVLDGMARTSFKRMYLFTTNNTTINENLIDRPSRIRYKFTFGRLKGEAINHIIKDYLDPELEHFASAIYKYVNSRKICTIDAIKSVVEEVNIHREDPKRFESFFNLQKKEDSSYSVVSIDEDGNETTVITYFKVHDNNNYIVNGSPEGIERIKNYTNNGHAFFIPNAAYNKPMSVFLTKLEDEEELIWNAYISKTVLDIDYISDLLLDPDFREIFHANIGSSDNFLVEDRPENWNNPLKELVLKLKKIKNKEEREELIKAIEKIINKTYNKHGLDYCRTEYFSQNAKLLRIKFKELSDEVYCRP